MVSITQARKILMRHGISVRRIGNPSYKPDDLLPCRRNTPLDSPKHGPQQCPQTRQWSSDPLDPRRCVVLVPFPTHIALQCQCGLEELQRRGYDVWRVGSYAAIDQGRNQMATDALAAGYEETFWIDSDIDFQPDTVDQLRSHCLPIVKPHQNSRPRSQGQ